MKRKTAIVAARLLGAGLWRRIGTIALPLARPALVAGVALALMETLADYGKIPYEGPHGYGKFSELVPVAEDRLKANGAIPF